MEEIPLRGGDAKGSHLEANHGSTSSNFGSFSIEGAQQSRIQSRRCQVDPLLAWTLLGVLAGAVTGIVMNQAKAPEALVLLAGFPGKLFLNTLKMLVLPLLSFSIMSGVGSLSKNKKNARKVSRLTVGYYILTTVVAVLIGVTVVNVIRPGHSSPSSSIGSNSCHQDTDIANHSQHNQTALESLLDIVEEAFPSNIVSAAGNLNVLGIVTFSIFFGVVASSLGEDGQPIMQAVEKMNKVIMKMVEIVLWLTPLGVGSLIAASIAAACDMGEMLQSIAMYIVTVIFGLALQGGVVLPLLYFVTKRENPLVLAKAFSRAFVTAFGTDSSSATLPVTIQCAKDLGYDESIINFVLPLGATVNMNGTALYEALTVIFIAQRHNVVLGAGQTLIVCITATVAAVGASAIPSAGLVTMLMVLQAVNLSQFSTDIALVLTVDWLLDRIRTVVNVEGDAVAVSLVQHICST
mmetsp:Transcript_9928/g.25297  ORF Transcript_9928/g.25297 Transcript_9928/m.25297 type:complete len:463 (-) Transcript_9928:62-1450(-)